MSEEGIAHVIDRDGYVWRVVRDGGMATRADYAGITSIGIAALERQAGPLVALEPLLTSTTSDVGGGLSAAEKEEV